MTASAVFIVAAISLHAQKLYTKNIVRDAEVQTELLLKEVEAIRATNPELVTPRTLEKGNLKLVTSRDWTSGFFPGVLWLLYAHTGKEQWKTQAETYTKLLEREKLNGGTHDMGFKINCSYGLGYKIAGNPPYLSVMLQSAKTLITRFNPVTGTIRSWDHNKDKWAYPVIIDNMMNLELLFTVTQLTGDSSFYKVAVTHANTTLDNHFRKDFSSYHVIDYDTLTGKVINRHTHQGYAHESAWARGQAWGLYGYAMCYRFTNDKKYLDIAEKIADYMLNHPNMPRNLVPYWDYNAPQIPNEERDVSAAAVLASGLYELSLYSEKGKYYRNTAHKIVNAMTKTYRAPIGSVKGFILLESVGSKPGKSEVNVPLTYADYYYLEALLRARKLKEGKSLF